MNITQNRTRIIEILVGLLATQLIVFGLAIYMFNEPERIVEAQGEILAVQLEDAMTLYAQNCSVCHGLAGEGIGAMPALDSDALRTMAYDDLSKTIARGRYDTAMPAWSKEDGGPLSDYQISELVALIQSGDWTMTRDRVVNLGLAPLVPFTTDPDPVLLDRGGESPRRCDPANRRSTVCGKLRCLPRCGWTRHSHCTGTERSCRPREEHGRVDAHPYTRQSWHAHGGLAKCPQLPMRSPRSSL